MITIFFAVLFICIVGILWSGLLEHLTGFAISMVPYALIVFAALSIFYICRFSFNKYLRKILRPLALTALALVLMYLLVIKLVPDTWFDSYTFFGRIWEMIVKLLRVFGCLFVITLMFVLGGFGLYKTFKDSIKNLDVQTSWKTGQAVTVTGLFLLYFVYAFAVKIFNYFGVAEFAYIFLPFILELIVLFVFEMDILESLLIAAVFSLGEFAQIIYRTPSPYKLDYFHRVKYFMKEGDMKTFAIVLALFILSAILIGLFMQKDGRCYGDAKKLCAMAALFCVSCSISGLSLPSRYFHVLGKEFEFISVALLAETFLFAAMSFSLKQAMLGAFMPFAAMLASRLYGLFCAGQLKKFMLKYIMMDVTFSEKLRSARIFFGPLLIYFLIFLVPALVIGLINKERYRYKFRLA